MTKKVVVFDLDKTLGYFSQLNCIWEILTQLYDSYREKDFYNLFDLFPEYKRTNIMTILTYLKKKKEENTLDKVMIYTNNNREKKWVLMIKRYFENKLNYKLFDRVIACFKLNGEIIEPCRTTYEKTYDDFMYCSKLNNDVKICFIDDLLHEQMINEQVYYIHISPYVHQLPISTIIKRISYSPFSSNININEFKINLELTLNYYRLDNIINHVDKHSTAQLMKHLQSFLKFSNSSSTSSSKKNTRKKQNKSKNKSTRKEYVP